MTTISTRRETSNPSHFRRAPIAVALLFASACQSGGSAQPAGAASSLALEAGRLAIPVSDVQYLRFDSSGSQAQSRDGTTQPAAVAPFAPGRPVSASFDLVSNSAAVAFEAGMATVDLTDVHVRWTPKSWPRLPQIVSVSGDHALTVAGDQVTMWRVRDGAEAWSDDVSPWLRSHELARLQSATPLGASEFALVGTKSDGTKPIVYRVSRAGGNWTSSYDQVVSEITYLQRCTSDGHALYLAGMHERTVPGHGAGPELLQDLLVVRVDLASMARSVVVRQELHALETDVVDLTAGEGWVGLVTRDGQKGSYVARIHRTSVGGASSRIVYEKDQREPVGLTWLGPDVAVEWTRAGDRFVDVQK